MDTAAEEDKPGLAPVCDNFSPQNQPFYAQSAYNPLDPIQQQIRLLRFLPSDDEEVLSFTLLDKCPLDSVRSRYTALSYCAGDPSKTEVVRVNGLEFNAFANLGRALKDVITYWKKNGKQVDDELLWADQICINQVSVWETPFHCSDLLHNILRRRPVEWLLTAPLPQKQSGGEVPSSWPNERYLYSCG